MTVIARPDEFKVLADGDVTRLPELETIIERGQQTFVEVGAALLEIRDSRLYREQYSSFDDYTRERWGWSRVHAHRVIEASEVIGALPIGSRPANEAQARELAKAKDPEVMHAVMAQVTETGQPVTARVIKDAVEERLNPEVESVEAPEEDPQARLREWNKNVRSRIRLVASLWGDKLLNQVLSMQQSLLKAQGKNFDPKAVIKQVEAYLEPLLAERMEGPPDKAKFAALQEKKAAPDPVQVLGEQLAEGYLAAFREANKP
jgi:hypothetical protein